MRLVLVLLALALLAVAASVARALVEHEGVGAFEWVAGVVLVVLLASASVRHARRGFHRT